MWLPIKNDLVLGFEKAILSTQMNENGAAYMGMSDTICNLKEENNAGISIIDPEVASPTSPSFLISNYTALFQGQDLMTGLCERIYCNDAPELDCRG